jgi:hypothetical protein
VLYALCLALALALPSPFSFALHTKLRVLQSLLMILPRFFSDAEYIFLEMAAAPENKGRKGTGDELAHEAAVTATK